MQFYFLSIDLHFLTFLTGTQKIKKYIVFDAQQSYACNCKFMSMYGRVSSNQNHKGGNSPSVLILKKIFYKLSVTLLLNWSNFIIHTNSMRTIYFDFDFYLKIIKYFYTFVSKENVCFFLTSRDSHWMIFAFYHSIWKYKAFVFISSKLMGISNLFVETFEHLDSFRFVQTILSLTVLRNCLSFITFCKSLNVTNTLSLVRNVFKIKLCII